MDFANSAIESVKRIKGETTSGIHIDKQDIQLRYRLDCQKLYQVLNWQPKISLNETIDSLVMYYMNQ